MEILTNINKNGLTKVNETVTIVINDGDTDHRLHSVPSEIVNMLTDACHSGISSFWKYIVDNDITDFNELDVKLLPHIDSQWLYSNLSQHGLELTDYLSIDIETLPEYILESLQDEIPRNHYYLDSIYTDIDGYYLQTKYNVNTYYMQTSDECLTESNYQYMRDNFICNTDRHYNVYFYLGATLETCQDTLHQIIDLFAELDRYPVLDEDDYNEREYNAVESYCDDNYEHDFSYYIDLFGDIDELKTQYYRLMHDAYWYYGEIYLPDDDYSVQILRNMFASDNLLLQCEVIPTKFNRDLVSSVEITAQYYFICDDDSKIIVYAYSENFPIVDFNSVNAIVASNRTMMIEKLNSTLQQYESEYF